MPKQKAAQPSTVMIRVDHHQVDRRAIEDREADDPAVLAEAVHATPPQMTLHVGVRSTTTDEPVHSLVAEELAVTGVDRAMRESLEIIKISSGRRANGGVALSGRHGHSNSAVRGGLPTLGDVS